MPLDGVYRNGGLIANLGGYFFMIPPLILLVFVAQLVSREKDLKLRQGLNMVGISHSVYMLSWLIVATLLNIVQCTILVLTSNFYNYSWFAHTSLGIQLTLFFWLGQTTIMMGLVIATILKTEHSATMLSMMIVVNFLCFDFLFSFNDLSDALFYTIRAESNPIIETIVFFFELLPPFQFCMIFGVIAHTACNHFSSVSMNWVPGVVYDDSMWYENLHFHKESQEGGDLNVPSPSHYMNKMYMDFVLLTFMWWYLDHVLSSNRGAPHNFYFIFQKQYWQSLKPGYNPGAKLIKNKRRQVKKEDIGLGLSESQLRNSAENEMNKVIQQEEDEVPADGLRIYDIRKTYFKSPFGRPGPKDVHAVNGIFLDVAQNELLCLLGHNGAGKSTLFNMLTGMVAPTSGYAKICGLDVMENQEILRKIMGVVPQFDILWNQLTPMDHMILFSKIKGVMLGDIQSKSNELLNQVGLEDVKHA